MRFFNIILITILLSAFLACGSGEKPATPVETLKAYTIAVKKKDATTMKLLLSSGTLKIHQQEAKAQNVTLDEIVLRDTLFPPDQRVFDYKNEKIEGDKATVEVKNNFDGYDVIHLVREEGIWKIDKKTTGEQMIQEIEDSTNSLEDQINQDRQKLEESLEDSTTPDPNASPGASPADPNAPLSPVDGSDIPQTNDGTQTTPPPPSDSDI